MFVLSCKKVLVAAKLIVEVAADDDEVNDSNDELYYKFTLLLPLLFADISMEAI